jgi:hypothetical protein
MIYLVYFAAPIVVVMGLILALATDPGVRWPLRARRPAEQRGIALLDLG